MRILASGLLIVGALLGGCGGDQGASAAQPPPQASPLHSVPTTRQIMLGMVAPTSDVVFGIAVEAPKDAAGWEKIEANAAVLTLSTELLELPPVAVDRGEWLKYCETLARGAAAISQAARQHDAQRVTDLGNQIYETCEGCHMKYFTARAGTQ